MKTKPHTEVEEFKNALRAHDVDLDHKIERAGRLYEQALTKAKEETGRKVLLEAIELMFTLNSAVAVADVYIASGVLKEEEVKALTPKE